MYLEAQNMRCPSMVRGSSDNERHFITYYHSHLDLCDYHDLMPSAVPRRCSYYFLIESCRPKRHC